MTLRRGHSSSVIPLLLLTAFANLTACGDDDPTSAPPGDSETTTGGTTGSGGTRGGTGGKSTGGSAGSSAGTSDMGGEAGTGDNTGGSAGSESTGGAGTGGSAGSAGMGGNSGAGGSAGRGGNSGAGDGGKGGLAGNAGAGGLAGASGSAGKGGAAGVGGSAGKGGNAGAAGMAGAGGNAGAAGMAGAGGNAGAAGMAGAGGNAGAAGMAGAGGNAGAGGSAGAAGNAGAGGSGGMGSVVSTPTRPQLTDQQAADITILKYFERGGSLVTPPAPDNWDPTAGVGDTSTFTPTYTVGSGGTHATIQEAVTAAVTAGGTTRIYIQVLPGTYREFVCVPGGAPPITLYSANADPSQTVVVNGHYAGEAKAAGVSANPCNANLTGTTYGTSGSATFAAFSANFMAKNLTFSNDFAEGTATSGIQAVALMTQGDRLVFENVRVLGNQDTLYVKSGNVDSVARSYFKSSYVEGDVDFIFGRGTAVLDGCVIQYLSSRRGASNGGDVLSPSTDHRNPYGFLVVNSQLTAETGTVDHTVALGRAWDEGSAALPADLTQPNPYLTAVAAGGAYTNGQTVIRNSILSAHIRPAPWQAAASSNRPYSSTDVVVTAGTYPANRLFEYQNSGLGNGG